MVVLVHDAALDAYDLGPSHPLRPERVSRTIALMREHGLIGPGGLEVVPPKPASDLDLLRVHDTAYIETVKRASADPERFVPERGIGPGDTPPFRGMHEAAALIAGASITAMRSVLEGGAQRAFSVAGGLHHAHSDRAAGFCVYNDPAVGIAWALERFPELRIAYIDIDAHHGDGVQEAFWDEPRVLTVSMHESGRYLFPGTGFEHERGGHHALGTALNVPMEPYADDAAYREAFDALVAPAVHAFRPDLIVTQNGADAHRADPLTTLGLTLRGYDALVVRTIDLARELTGDRIVAHGGGGYAWHDVVPRAWTALAYALLDREPPEELLREP